MTFDNKARFNNKKIPYRYFPCAGLEGHAGQHMNHHVNHSVGVSIGFMPGSILDPDRWVLPCDQVFACPYPSADSHEFEMLKKADLAILEFVLRAVRWGMLGQEDRYVESLGAAIAHPNGAAEYLEIVEAIPGLLGVSRVVWKI